MIFKPEGFIVQELVHPTIFSRYGEEESWRLLDTGMLLVLSFIREKLEAPITINNWVWGGERINSGLRTNWRSAGSAHRFGTGFDIQVKGYSPAEVHEFVKDNQEILYNLGLRRVEQLKYTPTWTHLDGKPAPLKVKPGKIDFFVPY